MSPKRCVKCGSEIEDSPTGRPRSYCGDICKRVAAYEITRLSRRIGRLEDEVLDIKLVRGNWDSYEPSHRGRYMKKLEKEIATQEQRLRDLLSGQA